MTIMACRLASAIAVVGTLTVAMTSGSFAAPHAAYREGFNPGSAQFVPSAPPPVFNPSSGYTVPTTPETPSLAREPGIGIWELIWCLGRPSPPNAIYVRPTLVPLPVPRGA